MCSSSSELLWISMNFENLPEIRMLEWTSPESILTTAKCCFRSQQAQSLKQHQEEDEYVDMVPQPNRKLLTSKIWKTRKIRCGMRRLSTTTINEEQTIDAEGRPAAANVVAVATPLPSPEQYSNARGINSPSINAVQVP